MALRSDLDMLPSRSRGSRRHVVQLRVDRLRDCAGEHGWEAARFVRAREAARVGMRRVRCLRRSVERGGSRDAVISPSVAVVAFEIVILT